MINSDTLRAIVAGLFDDIQPNIGKRLTSQVALGHNKIYINQKSDRRYCAATFTTGRKKMYLKCKMLFFTKAYVEDSVRKIDLYNGKHLVSMAEWLVWEATDGLRAGYALGRDRIKFEDRPIFWRDRYRRNKKNIKSNEKQLHLFYS